MLVYHGTNGDIDEICLTKSSRFRDFGQGFYVTPNIETAQRMAKKKTDLFGGTATLITFDFDESALTSDKMNVLVFPEKASSEWIYFIEKNRNRDNKDCHHDYDIIQGPIADDGVALQLDKLRVHAEQAEIIALDLQDKYLDQQICFCTPSALRYLIKKSVCKLN